MRFLRWFLAGSLIFFSLSLFALESEESSDDDIGMDAIRKWIRQKRMITVKELGGDLSLSGDVHVEMQGYNEQKNRVQQRGPNGATALPVYAYDVEFNLMLDYRSARTWGVIKVEYDNDMGQISGTTNRIALEKAYFGGRLIAGDTFTLDGEAGRRNIGNIYESKLQFGSLFDGILIKFNKASDAVGDFYFNPGVFLINDRINQYGYIGELGLLRIGNTGFYAKYSFVDWKRKFTSEINFLRFNFRISQAILGYQMTTHNIPVKAYLAGLLNHSANGNDRTGGKKANMGWYVGIAAGQVRKQGDWALDIYYQYAQAQAAPDFDAPRGKRGNAANVGFYTMNMDGTGAATTQATAVGNCNYEAGCFDFFYAISNSLTVQETFNISRNANKDIGPRFYFRSCEVELIYAF
jgi:hypothetical protein